MNKEEEIIKYIKDEIENETDTYHWFDNIPENKTKKQIEESINAHQGLLDLYNKEKEKREIAEENHKVLSLDLGQALKELGLYEDTIIADELVLEINKRYISKDKIREKIEALDDIESEYSKKILNISEETATFTIFVQEILKQLLEGDK